MKTFLYGLILIAAVALITTAVCGCRQVNPQTAAKITTIQNQNQVDLAAQKAKNALKQQAAKANPVAHPIVAASQAVEAAQKPLGLIATISFLITAVGVGLYFTPLSALSKIVVPVAGGVSAFSFFGVIALPFFPWVGLGLVVLAAGLLAYEAIRAKSLKGGIEHLESDIGFGSTAVLGTAPSPISPATVKLSHL